MGGVHHLTTAGQAIPAKCIDFGTILRLGPRMRTFNVYRQPSSLVSASGYYAHLGRLSSCRLVSVNMPRTRHSSAHRFNRSDGEGPVREFPAECAVGRPK